ncbi:MAG: FRG domain-containing protein [Bdellovibrionales bacterium]|nr:FRG domain-containing protein [Bdellovibrionales bacterium]
MMAIEERQVEDLQGLLAEVLQIAEGAGGAFFWFRGVDCSTHALLPKIARDGMVPDEIFEREARLLTRFRQRSMAYWPSGYPQNDWEHLFAMQHYGMPTRLLDWSENLFVAAYFALASSPDHKHEGDCIPVIWCVDPVAWNRFKKKISEYGSTIQVLTTADDELEPYRPDTTRKRNKSPIAIFGAHNSQRIVAQRGTFFVWGNETKPLDEVANDVMSTLWKIQLTGSRADLARDLQRLGFGETMVFPELSYLAAELTRTEGWKK